MTKVWSALGAALAGGVVAFFAVLALISSSTGAPASNPASGPLVQYGTR